MIFGFVVWSGICSLTGKPLYFHHTFATNPLESNVHRTADGEQVYLMKDDLKNKAIACLVAIDEKRSEKLQLKVIAQYKEIRALKAINAGMAIHHQTELQALRTEKKKRSLFLKEASTNLERGLKKEEEKSNRLLKGHKNERKQKITLKKEVLRQREEMDVTSTELDIAKRELSVLNKRMQETEKKMLVTYEENHSLRAENQQLKTMVHSNLYSSVADTGTLLLRNEVNVGREESSVGGEDTKCQECAVQ